MILIVLLFCYFFVQCVDEWLRVNASCPTCRKRIFPDANELSSTGSGGSATNATNRSAGTSSSNSSSGGSVSGANNITGTAGSNDVFELSLTSFAPTGRTIRSVGSSSSSQSNSMGSNTVGGYALVPHSSGGTVGTSRSSLVVVDASADEDPSEQV